MEHHTRQPTATPAETAQQARIAALRRSKNVGIVRVTVDHLRPAPKADGSPAALAAYGKLLDIDATRELCGGTSRSWVYRRLNSPEGFIPPVYIGKSLFFPQLWVEHWIAAQIEAQHPLGFPPASATSSAGLAA